MLMCSTELFTDSNITRFVLALENQRRMKYVYAINVHQQIYQVYVLE